MRVGKRNAEGFLGELLANIDQKELARMRKRMMLAVKIEEAMKRRGLNQIQFARLMGKSPTVISEWLSGDRNFTTDTLTDIEEALGVQLLNTTVMTVISAETASSYKMYSRSKKMSVVNPNSTWNTGIIAEECNSQRKFA